MTKFQLFAGGLHDKEVTPRHETKSCCWDLLSQPRIPSPSQDVMVTFPFTWGWREAIACTKAWIIMDPYTYIEYIVLHCLPILRRQFTTYGAATDGLYYCLLFMSYSQWSHKSSFCLTQYFLHSNATGPHNHTPVGLSSCYQIITWQGPTSATDLKKVQSKQTPSKEYLRTLGPVCWMKVCWLHVVAGMACKESTSCLYIVMYIL